MQRRTFLTSFAVSAATTTLLARDWSGQTPERYPDPDVIALSDRLTDKRAAISAVL